MAQTLAADHDYHIHSTLSACCGDPLMTPQTILSTCESLGLKAIAVTNHLWDSSMPGADDWYRPQDVAHLEKLLPFPPSDKLEFLFGCETEFCGGDKIGLSPEHYDVFDWIIVPFNHLHNNFSRPVDCVTPSQVAALYTDHFEDLLRQPLPWRKTGIAHLTCQLTYPHPNLTDVFDLLDERRIRAVFDTLAKRGAGVELNAGCFKPGWEAKEKSHLRIYEWARDAGCLFYCGSDAHSVSGIKRVQEWLPAVIEKLGLTQAQRFTPERVF
jgi:histidinol phosphatase-like PHP family hydrolase